MWLLPTGLYPLGLGLAMVMSLKAQKIPRSAGLLLTVITRGPEQGLHHMSATAVLNKVYLGSCTRAPHMSATAVLNKVYLGSCTRAPDNTWMRMHVCN